MSYVEFKITVQDERAVLLDYSDAGIARRRVGKLVPDPIAQFTVTRMNDWVNYGLAISEAYKRKTDLDTKDLQAIGLNLYRILFADPEVELRFRDLYDDLLDESAKGTRAPDRRMRLRLVFDESAAGLSDLPWELLFIPRRRMSESVMDKNLPEGSFFGQKDYLLLTRYSPLLGDAEPSLAGEAEPLKVLLAVYAKFPDLGEIRTAEIEIVRSAIKRVPGAKLLDDVIDQPYSAFKKRISSDKPDIVHFIGHGEAGQVALVYGEEDRDCVEGTAKEGQLRWFPASGVSLLFESHKPRLVFLQACNGSGKRAGGLSCADGLIRFGIPAVIAMQYSIRAYDAANFARIFYENLAKGADVDEAVRAGRHALGDPEYNHPRFGTPVIYLRTEERLFKEISTKQAAAPPVEPVTTPAPSSRAAAAVPNAVATAPAAERPSEPDSRLQRTA